MKITNEKLKQLIKEELEKVITETYVSDENLSRREELGLISEMPINELIQALDVIEADTQEIEQVIEFIPNNEGEKIKAVAKYLLNFDPENKYAQTRFYDNHTDEYGE